MWSSDEQLEAKYTYLSVIFCPLSDCVFDVEPVLVHYRRKTIRLSTQLQKHICNQNRRAPGTNYSQQYNIRDQGIKHTYPKQNISTKRTNCLRLEYKCHPVYHQYFTPLAKLTHAKCSLSSAVLLSS
jgi:hypothetical protein